jgi:DnaA family protein
VEQLPLGVRLRTSSTFATFSAGDNVALVAALEARARDPSLAPLWLWAPERAGKTHLLQAACARAAEHGAASAYLPLSADWPAPAMLAGLESLALVCLDDLDAVAGDAGWERALFVLYNELAERGGRLAFATRVPPAALAVGLPDLRSRLSAALVFRLQPLDEEAGVGALKGRALALGLELPDDVVQYLLRRLPRRYAELCDVLDRLDAAALARQRRLTVPFVRSVLGQDGAAAASGPDG